MVADVHEDDRQNLVGSPDRQRRRYKPVEIDPKQDVAVLRYTGGTTGVPKAAMLTHANITANARQVSSWYRGVQPGQERFLVALPFFHVFAMTVILLWD